MTSILCVKNEKNKYCEQFYAFFIIFCIPCSEFLTSKHTMKHTHSKAVCIDLFWEYLYSFFVILIKSSKSRVKLMTKHFLKIFSLPKYKIQETRLFCLKTHFNLRYFYHRKIIRKPEARLKNLHWGIFILNWLINWKKIIY